MKPKSVPAQNSNRQIRQAVFALIYTAVMLTIIEHVFLPFRVANWLYRSPDFITHSVQLMAGGIWAVACVVGYLVIPCAVVKIWQRQPLTSIGYSFTGFTRHVKIYVGLYLAMIPLIILASQSTAFQQVYPFVPEAKVSLSSYFIWEFFYVLQFISLEAFFRGYLLFTLEKVTHTAIAVAVMTVPYAMIHVHKPLPEACGAIIAGLVLGWLSLKYRSWVGGAMVHALVAVTLDSLACHRAGLF
jgi:membrane protease YdiL (CAAX protease family)